MDTIYLGYNARKDLKNLKITRIVGLSENESKNGKMQINKTPPLIFWAEWRLDVFGLNGDLPNAKVVWEPVKACCARLPIATIPNILCSYWKRLCILRFQAIIHAQLHFLLKDICKDIYSVADTSPDSNSEAEDTEAPLSYSRSSELPSESLGS